MRNVSNSILLGVLGAVLLFAADASAIPAFARETKLGCNSCHTIFPQLNRFGRDFRDNGFRTPDQIQQLTKKAPPPQSGVPAEDFWSFIPEQIPVSIQAKVHDAINPKGDVKNDFQMEELQLQSGGTFTPRVSYYLHHHLVEEGSPGTLYTGWVRFNNLAGSDWLNATVGQFELPVTFSPEIERLSSFEYLAYERQLGANGFNLNNPQLGIQVFGQSERGTKVWAGVVNGTGLAADESTGNFDSNSFKDVFGRVSQEIGEHVVGGFVYYGQTRVNAPDTEPFNDHFIRVGGDMFFNLRKAILYGSAIYARDDNPLGSGEQRSFYGGFAEGDVYLNERTVVLVRIDAVHQALPALFATPEDVDSGAFRRNTIAFTPGLQWLARPNVKLGFEYQVRQTREEDRALAQLHLSF